MSRNRTRKKDPDSGKNKKASSVGNGYPWINPIGGYGDMLMVGGVLKQVHDQDPATRFNLLRRTRYVNIFKGHPAIAEIGYPKEGEPIKGVDYWGMEKLGGGSQRAYQVLARSFGLQTPVNEVLYLHGLPDEDPFLNAFLPWGDTNIIIAPASDSPRKVLHPTVWHNLVDMLHAERAFVIQVGLFHEIKIRNAYTLQGQTDPRQLVKLLERADLVITADNFVMHAAHMTGTPAVVTWGPTQHEVYGYPEQTHIQRDPQCGLEPGGSCLISEKNEGGHAYATPCPLEEGHCLAQITAQELYEASRKVLVKGRG